jgi:hypothetical protein
MMQRPLNPPALPQAAAALNDTYNPHIPILNRDAFRLNVLLCQREVLGSNMPWVRHRGTMDLADRGPDGRPFKVREIKCREAVPTYALAWEDLEQAGIKPEQLGEELRSRFAKAVSSRRGVRVFTGSYQSRTVHWLRHHFDLVALLWAAKSQCPGASVGLVLMEWCQRWQRWVANKVAAKQFVEFWVL